MNPDESAVLQIRTSAMRDAIALYCCHRSCGAGGDGDGDGGSDIRALLENPREMIARLMPLRDALLEAAQRPGPV